MNHRVFGSLALLGVGALGVVAGPLDPPEGPITSTYKTLTQVEPRLEVNAQNAPGDAEYLFKISTPGSYYLTGNIKGVSGKGGILIGSSRVTLDLNGFAVEGVSGAKKGIRVNTHSGVAIRNGSVYDWVDGVDATETTGARLENLSSTLNANYGFSIGPNGMVSNCVSLDNNTGFEVFQNATLTACNADNNSIRGFDAGAGCTFINCTATDSGSYGFNLTDQAVLTGCISRGNGSVGFNVGESAMLTDCNAFENESYGFVLAGRVRATRCSARDSLGAGFHLAEGCSIVECTSSSNSTDGVRVNGNANTIERCTFHENGSSGINVMTGRGNSIDGNLCTYNTRMGVEVVDPDNLIVRNRARGNKLQNYAIYPGNDSGIILTNPGVGFTSSAAWANFEY